MLFHKWNKIYSIHRIYRHLSNIKNISQLDIEVYLNNIDIIFNCCNTYNTLLSYSLRQKEINFHLINILYQMKSNINIEFRNGQTPISYLIKNHSLIIIKDVFHIFNINPESIYNLNMYIHLCIFINKYDVFHYLIDNNISILLNQNIINIINKYHKVMWLLDSGSYIYHILVKGAKSKYINKLSNIPDELIVYIYKNIYI